MTDYSERELRAIVDTLGEIVDAGAFDTGAWGSFNDAFVEHFPGARASWQVSTDSGVGSFHETGWPEEALAEYLQHYGALNPFVPLWSSLRSNVTLPAGELVPSVDSFAHTEFVTDWLDPQGDLRGACGYKVHSPDRACMSYFSTHYPSTRAASYDRAMSTVLNALSARMAHAQGVMAGMVLRGEHAIDRASLTARAPSAAIIVSRKGAVRDANEEAWRLLASGREAGTRSIGGIEQLRFTDRKIQAWFERRLEAVLAARSDPRDPDDRLFTTARGTIRLRLARVPTMGATGFDLYFGTERALVLIGTGAVEPHAALRAARRMAAAHELTAAETQLCAALLRGLDLTAFSEETGKAESTVRHQLKDVFRKTGATRQAELVALLSSCL